ncbi:MULTISPECIES: 3-hexulose-6-phosphate synthase [Halanaerobium]|jgi:3-hexulose-6-phosphate synthase|uniref:3-hexulose-6-phosphate synthase n=1 Tax=Halanaerobium kushneri TaxID=56779 RepID=A0A1N6ZK14_9FIRM|nr:MULTISPECIES: 3-hexulose-6-phosphate synthase [Halanaerobium]RCW60356.1 3-hexulose-6-phosphate synthase [Halanaerobium sp. ST460_2HS_T2]SIR27159.1 3-hexulose-6-phosphate synthase [Halanaerobium kushneri]
MEKKERGGESIKKLQLAVDLTELKSSLKLLQQVGKYVDIIELGTPLLISEGISIIPIIKELYPDKIIFADLKIMDGGDIISELAFKKGADMISVLAAANDETIKAAIKNAQTFNAKVLVDMCAIKNIKKRAQEVEHLKTDYISVHRATDRERDGTDPLKELELIENIKTKKAVAGGINLNNFEAACRSTADTIIVGGAIYRSNNPASIARKMNKILNNVR